MRIVLVTAGAVLAGVVVLVHPAASPAPVAPAWSTVAPRRPAPRARPVRAVVYVAGEVRRPGVYTVDAVARVADAVARAGGARDDADLIAVNLAAPVHDGDEIIVSARGAAPAAGPHRLSAPRARAAPHRAASRRRVVPAAPVDVNAASEDEIAAVPGVGPALAARIVAFRDLNGRFVTADDLLDVAGITESRFDRIAPYVIVR